MRLLFSRSGEKDIPFCERFLCVSNKVVGLLRDWIFNLYAKDL